MTDDPVKAAPAVAVKKPRQGRSPAFPFISLEKALERADVFRIAEGGRPKHFSPIASAAKAWGIGPKTGQAIQTVAALGHYGLFEFEGSGDKRSTRLTDFALRILLDKQPLSPERDELIRQAALKPPVHAELWKKWGANFPSDPTFETYMVRDRGFSEGGSRDLMAEYKDTVSFAKLSQPVNISKPNGDDIPDPPLKDVSVGDMVQVEINGSHQFDTAKRVRAVQDHEGRKWVFIEGSETGVPMEQIILERKAGALQSALLPPVLPLEKDEPPPKGARKEITSLDEGAATLIWPDDLSAESVVDLEHWLNGILRKAKRRAGVKDDKKDDAAS